jgi:hypothetical protein
MNAADEAIEEIRSVRRSISAAYKHDIEKYIAHLKELERAYPEQLKAYKPTQEQQTWPPATARRA